MLAFILAIISWLASPACGVAMTAGYRERSKAPMNWSGLSLDKGRGLLPYLAFAKGVHSPLTNGAGLRVPDLSRVLCDGAVARKSSGAGDIQDPLT